MSYLRATICQPIVVRSFIFFAKSAQYIGKCKSTLTQTDPQSGAR